VVALGDVRGATGGIRVCRGGGRQVAAEFVQVAADGMPRSGATYIPFQLEYLEAPRSERLAAPLIRAYMRRANPKAMRRLGEALPRPGPQLDASRA
jgi:hypothetical protein